MLIRPGRRTPSAAAARPRSGELAPRLLVWGVVLALAGGAVAGFLVARHVVADQERRALDERAATIEVSLTSSEQSTIASLRVLAGIAAAPTPSASAVFQRVAAQQLTTASAVGVARRVGERYIVGSGVGTARTGTVLTPDRGAALARAEATRSFAVTLLPDPPRLLLALAVDDLVVFQESPLAPGSAAAAASPYDNLDLALFAAPTPDRARLVLSTAPLPLDGVHVSRPFAVGPDQWLLLVASPDPLAGSFTRRVPWLILAGGLLTAVLIGVVLTVLTRRRSYALRLVAQRTAALEEANRFSESLLTSGPMIVARSRTPDLTVTYLSPNATRILGLPPRDDNDHAQLGEGAHPEDLPRLRAALERVASGQARSASLELRARTGSGEYRWVSNVIVAERDPRTGEVTAVLSYLLDIDDRKKAEEELRTAQVAAETANQAKSQFLSRMSHELRTPMNAVLGFGQLLELDELTPKQRESVSHILKAGRHLLQLIDEVLDISRIESGTMTFSTEPVLPSDVVPDAVRLVEAMARERAIELRYEPGADEEPHVLADHQRLKQVLVNLLSNAVKYNVHGGRVTVRVERTDKGTVRIDVADTGPGIPSAQRDLLFTPFQRLGAEQGMVEGTGIGLALSRQLCEGMGGRLELVDTPHGSTFRIELPRADAPGSPATRTHDPATQKGSLMNHTPRTCVLQIEDNPSNARLMERLLEDRQDVELLVAPTGRAGLELARERLPKLVLLDLHLPDVHGEDVLRELQTHPTTSQIPVVVVSADGTHGQEKRLREAGAHAYLTKPFDIAELLALIDRTVALSPAD